MTHMYEYGTFVTFLMNIISWNCRGAASRVFPGRVRDLIRGMDIHVLFLLETRVSGLKADRAISRLGFNRWIHIEASGYAGGIWAVWNDSDVTVTYIASTTQYLHCRIDSIKMAYSSLVTCIYAEPDYTRRLPLWGDLLNLHATISDPWVILGDFNAYLTQYDKVGGGRPHLRSMQQFAVCARFGMD